MLKLTNKFEDFGISSHEVIDGIDNFLFIKKWNWEYSSCHAFQKFCVSYVQENSNQKIFILCNHPRVLTYGRGLQKPRKGEELNLVEFDLTASHKLPFPFYKIERGGGLTFHHPGQFIFYPILKLNPKNLALSQMTKDIFQFSSEILNDWGVTNLNSENKLLGLWQGGKKLASMGIAIDKLVTFHGMALNFFADKDMMKEMAALNPCGLDLSIYTSVDASINLKDDAIEQFSLEFIQKVNNAWK